MTPRDVEAATVEIPFRKLLRQGVFQEKVDGRIKFYAYVIRE